MTKYAVIKLVGKQYKVQEGDELVVDQLDLKEGEQMDCEVLLLKDENKTQVGTPLVDKAKVTIEVISNQKAKKIRVAKFKAKSRYRKVFGHRQHETVIRVVSIS